MLVYEGIKSGFIDDVDLGIIADKIRNKYIEVVKKRPSVPEFNSWKNSMQYMRGVLSDSEIPNNAGIAIEYNIPPTGCRIDFMMSGYNKGKSNVVIIELKQWDKATEVREMDGIYKVNTYTGGGMRDSIPIDKCEELGYDKIIVVLTRPLEYRKKKTNKLLVKLKYGKYPNFVNTINNRYINYNNTVEKIIDKENKKEIFVIRPSKTIDISRLEKDPNKLQEMYDLGVNDCKNSLDKLKEYINFDK